MMEDKLIVLTIEAVLNTGSEEANKSALNYLLGALINKKKFSWD